MDLPLWSAVGVGAGLCFFVRGFRSWRRLRLIEDLPTCRVRSMPLGRVELRGRAEPKAELEAPLTGRPCVYYRYRVEQEVGSGRHRHWKTLCRGDSAAWGFFLEDETGRVLIEPRGAELDLRHDWRRTDPALDTRLRAFLTQQGIDPRGWVFRKKLRFTEWQIAPGDPLYVLGVAQERPGLAGERRRRIREKLAAIRSDPDTMRELDANGDGAVDGEEWEVARRLVLHEVGSEPVEDQVVVAAAPRREAPFYVSNRDEARVQRAHRLRSVAGIWGGAALALGCSALLLRHAERVAAFFF